MLARWLRFVDLRHGCLDIVSLPVSERGRNLQCRGALGGELVFAFACGASSAQRAMHFSTFSFRAGSAEAHEGSKGPSGNCCATLVADSLNEEMRKKQDAAARQVKAAADVKRLEEIKKQQAMTIAGDAKEREAKHASRKDALRRANLARDERMQEFEKKLNEADERVSNQLAKNASDLASRICDKYEKGQYALRRKHEHEQEMFQHAIHRMDLRKEKEESVNSLMERKREDMQEKANENRSKFLQRLMQVQSNREKQESDNSAAHYSSVKKHESVRANHEERLKGFSAELHQKLDKGHQMAKKNLDRQNAEKEGIRKELEKKIRDEAAASAENASSKK